MDTRTWWIALLLVVACAWSVAPTFADEEEPPMGGDSEEEADPAAAMADMFKRMDAMLKGMSKFVGDTRLTEESVQSLLKHGASFHAIGDEDEADEDKVQALLEESFRTKGEYDFGLILGVKELQAWAKVKGVDAGAWLRSQMRAQGLYLRSEMIANAETAKKEVAEQLAQLEAMRKEMGEETYQVARKAMEAGVKMAEQAAKSAKDAIPAPTEVEAKLLATHGTALRTAVEGPDEEEDENGMDDGD